MGIAFMVFMVVGGVVAMWAVQRDNKIGQGLKQIETEERDGPVLRGLFGGGTGETGGGRKGIWVWSDIGKLRERRRRAISTRKFSSIATC